MSGKGDAYRPVDRKKWEKGYARAFGKTRHVGRVRVQPDPRPGDPITSAMRGWFLMQIDSLRPVILSERQGRWFAFASAAIARKKTAPPSEWLYVREVENATDMDDYEATARVRASLIEQLENVGVIIAGVAGVPVKPSPATKGK